MRNPVTVEYTTETGEPPRTRSYDGDAGNDLLCSREILICPGDTMDIPTGIRVKLPEGYFARIVGRSSAFRRGLIVIEGIIDTGYTGELFVCVLNYSTDDVWVKPGERIAQMILQPIIDVGFVEVETLPITERGTRGFGSSGS